MFEGRMEGIELLFIVLISSSEATNSRCKVRSSQPFSSPTAFHRYLSKLMFLPIRCRKPEVQSEPFIDIGSPLRAETKLASFNSSSREKKKS